MVVLDDSSMLTTGPHQYLQPDYLSPLPTSLDSKKSPLALLAQTCSQIGADSPSKPLISTLDKPSKASSARSPPAAKLERSRGSPSDGGSSGKSSGSTLAFKPYESTVVQPSSKRETESSRPASKASVQSAGDRVASERESVASEPSAKRTSPSPKQQQQQQQPQEPAAERGSPAEKPASSPRRTSPVIRPGMDVLSGKDSAAYKPSAYSGLCCPPGLEPSGFRAPFSGFSGLLGGYGAGSGPAAGNPYLGYARVKTAAGGESLVAVCKDPYCTGCQYSLHNVHMMMAAAAAAASGGAGSCPSGCTQCEHQKYGLMALGMHPAAHQPQAGQGYAPGRPHVCSWVAGDSYCGKRFASSDELLQHLRSHTSGVEHQAALLAAQHPLLSPQAAAQLQHPSLSPLGAARYHPYGKPPPPPPPPQAQHPLQPAGLAASPYSAFNALSPYYSPYALYGQRIGAAVHP